MKSNYADVPMLKKVMQIAQCFRANSSMSAAEIARAVDMPKTTLYRLLNSMAEYGFLTKLQDSKSYQLGPLFSAAVFLKEREFEVLKKTARASLEKLSEETHETVKISVLYGKNCYVLDKVEGKERIHISVDSGSVFPVYAGASSRILLASVPQEIRNLYLDEELKSFTVHTITDKKLLFKNLRQIEEEKVAVDPGEFVDGVGAVAGPIRNKAGSVIAAVSIAYAILADREDTIERYKLLVRETAQEISRAISADL